jgi:aminomethyltransferase
MTDPKHTPLHGNHSRAGARFVDFGGWDMPVQYTGTLLEHDAVRTKAGLFDVSHMGEVVLRGKDAIEALNRVITNDIHRITNGRAIYTVMCRPDGGIVDDLIIYRVSDEELFLCVNASNREKDFTWIRDHLEGDVVATDESENWAQIALQGPLAPEILARFLNHPELLDMKPFRFIDFPWNGHSLRIATTGYTGSGGFEIYLPAECASEFWDGVMAEGSPQGLIPAGLGSRDTLRLEKGYCLYGNDIDDTTTPLEAGLSWVVRLQKDTFIGKEALEKQKLAGIPRKLVGFGLTDRGIARAHHRIFSGTQEIGHVTSGNMSPVLKRPIGMAYVETEYSEIGTEIFVEIRGRMVAAIVESLPFL